MEETGDVLRNQELHYISKGHLSLHGNKTMRLMEDRLVDNEYISRLRSRPSRRVKLPNNVRLIGCKYFPGARVVPPTFVINLEMETISDESPKTKVKMTHI